MVNVSACRLKFLGLLLALFLCACGSEESDPCQDYFDCLCGTDTACIDQLQHQVEKANNVGYECKSALQVFLDAGGTCK